MDEPIECPVCTLFLRPDMSLDDHLYSHTKEYAINMSPPRDNSSGIIVAGSSNTNTGESQNDDAIIGPIDYSLTGRGTQPMRPSPRSAEGSGSGTGSGSAIGSGSATGSEFAEGSWILKQRDLLEAGPSGRRELDKVAQQCTTQREGSSGIKIHSDPETHSEALVTDVAPTTTSQDTLDHHTGSDSNQLQFPVQQHPYFVQQPTSGHEGCSDAADETDYEDAEDENEERVRLNLIIAQMTQDYQIWKQRHIRIMENSSYM